MKTLQASPIVDARYSPAPTYFLVVVLTVIDASVAIAVLDFVPHDKAVVLIGMIGSILTPAIATLLIKAVVMNMEARQVDISANASALRKNGEDNKRALRGAYATISNELIAIRARRAYDATHRGIDERSS